MMLRALPEFGGLVHLCAGALLDTQIGHKVTLTLCTQTAFLAPVTVAYENGIYVDIVDDPPNCIRCLCYKPGGAR